MDRYSIFAHTPTTGPQPVPGRPEEQDAAKAPAERLQFPADDGGRSLSEVAQRDLNAALQLLTERAQYITGASGAAIALRHGGEMVCRACAGSSAPELGTHLQVDSGLSGESVRTRQILRCNDAGSDTRVNRESCRALGISSVMVMPLVRDNEVTGVFELFSERVNAFEERDIVALQRIAEMIQTAVEHAEAAEHAEKRIAAHEEVPIQVEVAEKPAPKPLEEKKEEGPKVEAKPESVSPAAVTAPARLTVRTCSKCGFPVSEGRSLCVDCEVAQGKEEKSPATAETESAFVPRFGTGEIEDESWLGSHWYVVAVLVAIGIAAGVWLWSH
jgi:putative methionine-R-sulfoxide reductase with GAF domain